MNCHSVSHQYFVFPNALRCITREQRQSVTLSISNKHLTIAAPGDANAQVSWDLSPSGTDFVPGGLDTLGGIIATLKQRGVFAVTADPNMKTAVKSEDLADVSSQDIKNAAYTLTMDKPRLMNDELAWSKAWMNANLTGISGNRSVKLVWDEAGVTGYNVYRSVSNGGPYTKVAGPVTDLVYVDYQVSPQQVWYYVVTALNQAGESGRSNQVPRPFPEAGCMCIRELRRHIDGSHRGCSGIYRSSGWRSDAAFAQRGHRAGDRHQCAEHLEPGYGAEFSEPDRLQLSNKIRALVFKSAGVGSADGTVLSHE